MQRRNFLKSLLTVGVALSPASVLIDGFPMPAQTGQATVADDVIFGSDPYSIIVENVSGRIGKADIFGSFDYVFPNAEHLNQYVLNDKYVRNGIEISSVTAGKTYQDILYELMNKPFICEKLIIEANNKEYIWKPFLVQTKRLDGIAVTIPISPGRFIDPYHEDVNSICIENAFMVDAFTKIVFDNLEPGTKLALQFYRREPQYRTSEPRWAPGKAPEIIKGKM